MHTPNRLGEPCDTADVVAHAPRAAPGSAPTLLDRSHALGPIALPAVTLNIYLPFIVCGDHNTRINKRYL
jgi:hypothetical protein